MRRFCIPPKTGGKLVRLAERRTVHEGLSSGGYENQSLHDLTWRRRFTEALAGSNPQLQRKNGKGQKRRENRKQETQTENEENGARQRKRHNKGTTDKGHQPTEENGEDGP